METNTIHQQFQNLSSSQKKDAYNVIDIPNMPHKLGMSDKGFPIFFVVTNESPYDAQNIERELLSVEYDLPCIIIVNNQSRIHYKFSLITLHSTDKQLQNYFIDIFIMMLEKILSNPSKRRLSIEIENLITIFSALSNRPLKKIQGLWAELLVIERSLDPETLISAWHNHPNAKYDFTMGRDKIEVKSTSSEERVHHFSLDQLNPSPNSRLLIASVVVRESAQSQTGLSVRGLCNKICERINKNNLKLRLYSIIALTIGNNYANLDQVFFDYTEASDTLAFFNAKDVPHIDKDNVQPFISEVKFTSNLTHLVDIKSIDSNFDRNDSLLFKSLY